MNRLLKISNNSNPTGLNPFLQSTFLTDRAPVKYVWGLFSKMCKTNLHMYKVCNTRFECLIMKAKRCDFQCGFCIFLMGSFNSSRFWPTSYLLKRFYDAWWEFALSKWMKWIQHIIYLIYFELCHLESVFTLMLI